jgi:hypothetical protein
MIHFKHNSPDFIQSITEWQRIAARKTYLARALPSRFMSQMKLQPAHLKITVGNGAAQTQAARARAKGRFFRRGYVPAARFRQIQGLRTSQQYAKEGYAENVITYVYIHKIAVAASSAGLQLQKGEHGDMVDVHPTLDLLRRPNPMNRGSDFIYSLIAWRLYVQRTMLY